MIVFQCQCGYIWIIDFEAAKVIGPIIENQGVAWSKDLLPIFIGNQRNEIAMGYFRDMYSDCWEDLLRHIPSQKAKK
jgi:hypothetical protein